METVPQVTFVDTFHEEVVLRILSITNDEREWQTELPDSSSIESPGGLRAVVSGSVPGPKISFVDSQCSPSIGIKKFVLMVALHYLSDSLEGLYAPLTPWEEANFQPNMLYKYTGPFGFLLVDSNSGNRYNLNGAQFNSSGDIINQPSPDGPIFTFDRFAAQAIDNLYAHIEQYHLNPWSFDYGGPEWNQSPSELKSFLPLLEDLYINPSDLSVNQLTKAAEEGLNHLKELRPLAGEAIPDISKAVQASMILTIRCALLAWKNRTGLAEVMAEWEPNNLLWASWEMRCLVKATQEDYEHGLRIRNWLSGVSCQGLDDQPVERARLQIQTGNLDEMTQSRAQGAGVQTQSAEARIELRSNAIYDSNDNSRREGRDRGRSINNSGLHEVSPTEIENNSVDEILEENFSQMMISPVILGPGHPLYYSNRNSVDRESR